MWTSYEKFTQKCWRIFNSLIGIAINIVYLGLPFIGASFTAAFWLIGSLLFFCYGCFRVTIGILPVISVLIWNSLKIILYVIKYIIAKFCHSNYPSFPKLHGYFRTKKISSSRMSGEEFEKYVANKLIAKGYRNIQFTPATGDYGVDILATKHGKVYAFQCKCYTGSVGVHAVQEIYSGSKKYKADKAIVVTNSQYTPNAKELAHDLGVSLWELDVLDNFGCD